MINRPVPTAQHKQRASAHIRGLAKKVQQTFPDMMVHQHLTDAARETDAGRHENAKRHLDAAIGAFAPLHLIRHGIHDDEGHRAAKAFMHEAHRGRLLVADAEHIANANLELNERRIAVKNQADQDKADKRNAQLAPAGASPGAQLSWEDIDMAVELATFAGKPPGSGANFAKLSASLAKRGARNPGALAAYIGRKKYGRKGFAKLSHHAVPTAGGIELVGPKGYIHGWIKASAAHLAASGGGAYLPEHPGFGHMTKTEHRRAAAGHLHHMNQSPAGSQKAQLHHKFAKLHAAASLGKTVQRSGYAIAGSRNSTNLFANSAGGIELIGPKGYSHGWVYHGRPSGGAAPGRFFMGGKQVSEREYQQRTNAANKVQGLKPQFPSVTPVPSAPGQRLGIGHISLSSAFKYHGKRVRGAVGGNGGVVTGVYNHGNGTIRDARGRSHKVISIDPSAYEASFKGDVASSHLPADVKARMGGYEHALQTGAVYQRSRRMYRGPKAQAGARSVQFSAETGRLVSEPHPFGKPSGPGLWGVKGMELPPYIQNIARALLRKGRAKSLSQAIAMAKGATARWAAGKNTSPEVRAASAATNAQWAAKQARAHAHANPPGGIELIGPGGWSHGWIRAGQVSRQGGDSVLADIQTQRAARVAEARNDPLSQQIAAELHKAKVAREGGDHVQATIHENRARGLAAQQELAARKAKRVATIQASQPSAGGVELTGTAAGAAQDPRIAAGQPGGGRFGAGQQQGGDRKAKLLALAKSDRAKAKLLSIRIRAMRAALASASGKTSKGQKGATTSSGPSTTGSSAPAAKGTAAQAAKTQSPMSNAATGLSTSDLNKATAAAGIAAKRMSKAQLTSAIKALTTQERNLLAAAATATSQAAKA